MHCDVCRRTSLSLQHHAQERSVECAGCGKSLRILPGETFAVEDAGQFERLERAFHEAKLGRATLAFIAREFAVRRSTPAESLRSVVAAVPALAMFDLLTEPTRAAESKAERMLSVLVAALTPLR